MHDLTLRGPTSAEIPRVRHLFRRLLLPPQVQMLIAVRRQPVERFVAALAGWAEGEFVRFHLASQPDVATEPIAKRLIEEAGASARAAGVQKLLYRHPDARLRALVNLDLSAHKCISLNKTTPNATTGNPPKLPELN